MDLKSALAARDARVTKRTLTIGVRVLVVLALASFVGIVSALTEGRVNSVPRVSAAPGVYLQIDDGSGAFVFAPDLCDADNLSPANSRCTAQLEIANVGEDDSSPSFYTIAAWADTDGDDGDVGPDGDTLSACFNVNLLLGTADGLNVGSSASDGPLPGSELAVGASQTWGLEASVTDDNVCQGAEASIIVAVVGVGDELALPDVDPGPEDDFDNPPETTTNTTETDTSTTTNNLVNEVQGVQNVPGATNQAPTLVNEVQGVRRLPVTGSGGLLGRGSSSRAAVHAAITAVLLAAAITGFGLYRDSRRPR